MVFSILFLIVACLFYGMLGIFVPFLWIGLIFFMMGTELTLAAFGTAISELVEQEVFHEESDLLTNIFWAGVHGIVSLNLAGKLLDGTSALELEEVSLNALFQGLVSKGQNGNSPDPEFFNLDRRDT